MDSRAIQKRIEQYQREAEAARKSGDREAYWQARRRLLNAQAELMATRYKRDAA
jgi:uncharacterized membrane protein (DUF106 family)